MVQISFLFAAVYQLCLQVNSGVTKAYLMTSRQ